MTINYTHRTWAGFKARIICTDFQHSSHPNRKNLCTIAAVLDLDITGAESLVFLMQDLRKTATSPEPCLTEYNPWQDVAIDTPVWVRDADDQVWLAAHFAGVHHGGELFSWLGGRTSHTASGRMMPWRQMTLTNPNTNSEQS